MHLFQNFLFYHWASCKTNDMVLMINEASRKKCEIFGPGSRNNNVIKGSIGHIEIPI